MKRSSRALRPGRDVNMLPTRNSKSAIRQHAKRKPISNNNEIKKLFLCVERAVYLKRLKPSRLGVLDYEKPVLRVAFASSHIISGMLLQIRSPRSSVKAETLSAIENRKERSWKFKLQLATSAECTCTVGHIDHIGRVYV